jgi:hypothetical protein
LETLLVEERQKTTTLYFLMARSTAKFMYLIDEATVGRCCGRCRCCDDNDDDDPTVGERNDPSLQEDGECECE